MGGSVSVARSDADTAVRASAKEVCNCVYNCAKLAFLVITNRHFRSEQGRLWWKGVKQWQMLQCLLAPFARESPPRQPDSSHDGVEGHAEDGTSQRLFLAWRRLALPAHTSSPLRPHQPWAPAPIPLLTSHRLHSTTFLIFLLPTANLAPCCMALLVHPARLRVSPPRCTFPRRSPGREWNLLLPVRLQQACNLPTPRVSERQGSRQGRRGGGAGTDTQQAKKNRPEQTDREAAGQGRARGE